MTDTGFVSLYMVVFFLLEPQYSGLSFEDAISSEAQITVAQTSGISVASQQMKSIVLLKGGAWSSHWGLHIRHTDGLKRIRGSYTISTGSYILVLHVAPPD